MIEQIYRPIARGGLAALQQQKPVSVEVKPKVKGRRKKEPEIDPDFNFFLPDTQIALQTEVPLPLEPIVEPPEKARIVQAPSVHPLDAPTSVEVKVPSTNLPTSLPTCTLWEGKCLF